MRNVCSWGKQSNKVKVEPRWPFHIILLAVRIDREKLKQVEEPE
jgi:hypothetical protein